MLLYHGGTLVVDNGVTWYTFPTPSQKQKKIYPKKFSYMFSKKFSYTPKWMLIKCKIKKYIYSGMTVD